MLRTSSRRIDESTPRSSTRCRLTGRGLHVVIPDVTGRQLAV